MSKRDSKQHMSYRVCHFQQPLDEEVRSTDPSIEVPPYLCALTQWGSKNYKIGGSCDTKLCPMFQTWKLLSERGESLKML
jgi:hypothetical protein